MFRIHSSDSKRIMSEFTRVVEDVKDHPRLVLKLTLIALSDSWISANEWKWEKRRRKLVERIDKFNFEASTTIDLDQL